MSRKTARLSKNLHRDLSLYTLAASAAGMSALSVAPPAEAQIVYTPAHAIIGRNGSLPIVLNNDGITDITIREIPWSLSPLFPGNSLQAVPAHGVGLKAGSRPQSAAKMVRGSEIGPSVPFRTGGAGVMFQATSYGVYYGASWFLPTPGYLGIRFRIGRETHYGWARLEVRIYYPKKCIEALLTGYAYETQPNKPIRAGDTGQNDADEGGASQMLSAPTTKGQPTLGALAFGANGLSVWRVQSH